jgi:SAM-dependent methyltransferase
VSSRTARDQRRRALGQKFLTDDRAIAAVVGTLHPPPASGDVVIDIGAGSGALTAAVAATGARVIAIERDPHWARVLGARAAAWGSVEVVLGDALRLPFPAGSFRVISSAPYGIGTQIVRRLMTDAHGLPALAGRVPRLHAIPGRHVRRARTDGGRATRTPARTRGGERRLRRRRSRSHGDPVGAPAGDVRRPVRGAGALGVQPPMRGPRQLRTETRAS